MSEKNLEWTAVHTEHPVSDEWIDFRSVTYRLPDGREVKPYYNYSRRDFAVVIARDTEGRFIVVKQYRHGIREVTNEFPAGAIENVFSAYAKGGKASSYLDTALETAKRELQEETGYVSDDWTHLITVPSDATLGDNYGFLFFADHCRKQGVQKMDDTEFIETAGLYPEEIDQLIAKGEFQQAIHIMGWLMARNRFAF